MSLLPSSATYGEQIADVVAHYRGRGLILSPRDVDLVLEWQHAGIPVRIAIRGIQAAAEARSRTVRRGTPPITSLWQCRDAVEREWKRHRELTAGQGGDGADQ